MRVYLAQLGTTRRFAAPTPKGRGLSRKRVHQSKIAKHLFELNK
jgi:hypothetical protein